MKSILLYVDEDSSMEARLQAALNLARALDAEILCLQAIPLDILLSGQGYAGICATPDTDPIALVRQRADLQRVRLQVRLEAIDVRCDWLFLDRDRALALIEQGSFADIIVLGLPSDANAAKARSLAADIALTVRTPVLVIPDQSPQFDCTGTAVIAWNGSFECAHALQAAIPILCHAASVHIVTVPNGDIRLPVKSAAEYLSKHGVASETSQWRRDGRCTGDVLLEATKMLGGGYLVLGAYGHSRFRETIFGGVTQELLETPAVPMLLTH